MTSPKPDIEAELTFIPTEQGGRQGYAASGYRAQFYYDGGDWDALQTYVGVEKAYPGDTVTANLFFLSPQQHVGKLYPGKVFLVREGKKVVAYGKVTRVIDLEISAERVKRQSQ